MRRPSVVLLLILTLVLLAGAIGCGGGASGSNVSPAGQAPAPEDALAAAMAASDGMTSATGSFDVALSFNVDPSKLSAQDKATLENPMKMSGTVAYGSQPLAMDLTVSLAMMGKTMDVGFKALGDKAWISLQDKWYETPAEMQGMMQGMMNGNVDVKAKRAQIQKLISDLGVDPVTWITDLRLVGEETIDGDAVYHLTGTPDVAKMIADVVGLMKSKELMALIDPTGMMTKTMQSGSTMPSADDLTAMQTQVAAMLQNFTIDFWMGKADSMLRKTAITAHITPPPGEDAAGVNSIDLKATISLSNINQPVTVEAPASALPFTAIEQAIQDNPDLMGMFSGASQGTGSN